VVLPIKWKPPNPPLCPSSGMIHETKQKRQTKPVKHKHGQGVKKPLKPVNGQKRKVKCNLHSFAMAAVLSPTLLFNMAIAQVPTFDFHSEITRIQDASSVAQGYLSIRDISPNDQDMVRLKAVMKDIPQGLLGSEDNMYFIVDSGASRTSTFDPKDFVPG